MDAVISRYAHPESRGGQGAPLSDEERTGLGVLWAQFIFEAGVQVMKDALPPTGATESEAYMRATGALEEADRDD